MCDLSYRSASNRRPLWLGVMHAFLGALRGLGGATVALSATAQVACTLWPALASAADPSAVPSPSSAPHAWVVGSSSVAQSFGNVLERELRQKGYVVSRKAFSSAGLSRPDFRDMHRVMESLPIGGKTAAVFVYLGVNDAQALWLRRGERMRPGHRFLPWRDPRWSGIYRERARLLLERVCQRGARRAVFVLPVDVTGARLQRRLERIRRLQVEAAARTSCGLALSTGGDAGVLERPGAPIRYADGFHMTTRGARLVWQRIRARTWRALGEPDRVASGQGARVAMVAALEAAVKRLALGQVAD